MKKPDSASATIIFRLTPTMRNMSVLHDRPHEDRIVEQLDVVVRVARASQKP